MGTTRNVPKFTREPFVFTIKTVFFEVVERVFVMAHNNLTRAANIIFLKNKKQFFST